LESLIPAYGLTHLTEALFHYNEALQQRARGASDYVVASMLFHCLNKLQTGMTDSAEAGEVEGFLRLVKMGASTDAAADRFLGPELRALADLQPQVMDHSELRHGYRPNQPVSPSQATKATSKHRSLVKALDDWERNTSEEAFGLIVKRTAQLLYIVRSNIAHGEKTPYGPDLTKLERDETVCRLALPLQLLLVDLLLDEPSQKLVAYGTLAPGEPNHMVVESLDGTWLPCTIEATVATHGGLPVLVWRPGSGTPEVSAMLLHSVELADQWARLDAFEGGAYRRELVTVTVSEPSVTGTVRVGNAYVGALR
jgi:gamma-glutamylcyclotransferase (GGCT)/AIG2-like uncharacterized protein YtfP